MPAKPAMNAQPFRQFKRNPSWEALEPFNGTELRLSDGRTLTLTGYEMPVEYEQVNNRVAAMYKSRVSARSASTTAATR